MSQENLKPFKSGDEWKGNAKGKPKGTKHIGPILKKVLNSKMSVEVAGKRGRRTVGEIIAMKLAKDAMDDRNTAAERIRAAVAIMDRTEGKPSQPITGPSGTPLVPPTIIVNFVEGQESEEE